MESPIANRTVTSAAKALASGKSQDAWVWALTLTTTPPGRTASSAASSPRAPPTASTTASAPRPSVSSSMTERGLRFGGHRALRGRQLPALRDRVGHHHRAGPVHLRGEARQLPDRSAADDRHHVARP